MVSLGLGSEEVIGTPKIVPGSVFSSMLNARGPDRVMDGSLLIFSEPSTG